MSLEKIHAHQFLNAMAQRHGSSETFTYYTMDNEYKSNAPHVHVCVPIDDTQWVGTVINGKYKTICAIKLEEKHYTLENLEFEHIVKGNVLSTKCKKEIVVWLNSQYKNRNMSNAAHALDGYEDSNGD